MIPFQENLISEHVFRYNNLDKGQKIKTRNAIDLVFNHRRFDLIVKFLYAKSYLEGNGNRWLKELYVEHIRYFNNFYEDNFPNKNCGDDFCNSFSELINLLNEDQSIRKSTIIPVSINKSPLDGAHRLAILAANNSKVNTITLQHKFPLTCYDFNYTFFKKKGMPDKYMDYIALEYAKLNPKSYIFCIFPSSTEKWNEVEIILKNNSCIFYDKEVWFSEIGKLNFIINLYRNEKWLGDNNNGFEGAHYKMKECFGNSNSAKIYLIHSEQLSDTVKLKQEIRDLCGIGNHSVHSTDQKKTTVELASIVFSENTLNYINVIEQGWVFSNFSNLFQQYKKYVLFSRINTDNFCIEGSAILAALNLRDCYDLDFFYLGNEEELPLFPSKIDCHNNYYNHEMRYDKIFNLEIVDILTNPELHFYIEGYKVMQPKLIRKFKKYRNEPKDVTDVMLIDRYLGKVNFFLLPKPNEKKVDPSWYSKFDNLLQKHQKKGIIPPISPNALLSLSGSTINAYLDWSNINQPPINIKFDPGHVFFTFELFQTINMCLLDDFFLLAEEILSDYYGNSKSDYFYFIKLCFIAKFKNSLSISKDEYMKFKKITCSIKL